MFALSSIGVALAIVPIMMGKGDDLVSFITPVRVFLRVTFGVAIITICTGYIYMHFKSKAGTGMLQIRGHEGDDLTLRSNGDWVVVTAPKRSLQTKYMLITLFVFGIGAMLNCVLHIIQLIFARTRFMAVGLVDHNCSHSCTLFSTDILLSLHV